MSACMFERGEIVFLEVIRDLWGDICEVFSIGVLSSEYVINSRCYNNVYNNKNIKRFLVYKI